MVCYFCSSHHIRRYIFTDESSQRLQYICLVNTVPERAKAFRKQINILTLLVHTLFSMLLLEPPPTQSSEDHIVLRRRMTDPNGAQRPALQLKTTPQSNLNVANPIQRGSLIEVRVLFDISIVRDQSDGLPRTDIFLSFDQVTHLPNIHSSCSHHVSVMHNHAIVFTDRKVEVHRNTVPTSKHKLPYRRKPWVYSSRCGTHGS